MKKMTDKIGQSNQRGQIGIIVLLTTVVLITIGISVVSRSVTDVKLSEQEEQSTRAFDAAEAGIEEALRQDMTGGIAETTITVGDIDVLYQAVPKDEMRVRLREGETVEVDISSLPNTSQFIVRWGEPDEICEGNPDTAAIIASIYNSSNEDVKRSTHDICSSRRSGFDSADASTDPLYKSQKSFTKLANDEYMRIQIVYGPDPLQRETLVNVSAPAAMVSLPVQYYSITSEAQTSTLETKAIEVTRTLPAPPSIFDFVLFTKGSLVK